MSYHKCLFSIIPMNYYGRNDIHLGEFLQRYCFRDNYVCQSCTVDMSKHQRHFAHGNREIRISMQPLTTPIPGGENKMFTWLTCLQCSQVMQCLHFSCCFYLSIYLSVCLSVLLFSLSLILLHSLSRTLHWFLCLRSLCFSPLPNF